VEVCNAKQEADSAESPVLSFNHPACPLVHRCSAPACTFSVPLPLPDSASVVLRSVYEGRTRTGS